MIARIRAFILWLLASLAALISIGASLCAALIAPDSQYARNLLVGHDQDGNAALGGDPDETISSRLAKRTADGCVPCRWICRFLALLDNEHCKRSLEADEGKDAVID